VAVTKEVETAALEALDAVHACGLLHGDISRKNIMVVRGKQPSVRFLDFGFSRFKSNKKLQKAERMYLEQLLVHLMKQRRE
jgi:tRNA A-37 threonylcarbamoyl transferase component Bud32